MVYRLPSNKLAVDLAGGWKMSFHSKTWLRKSGSTNNSLEGKMAELSKNAEELEFSSK